MWENGNRMTISLNYNQYAIIDPEHLLAVEHIFVLNMNTELQPNEKSVFFKIENTFQGKKIQLK